MKRSDFQFQTPSMLECEYSTNLNYDAKKSKGAISVNVNFEKSIELAKTKNKDGRQEALVRLEVDLSGKEENSSPFNVKVTMGAIFSWSEESEKGASVEELLNINAPTLLLGYIRQIVSVLTNASPFPVYNIPFINFTVED